MTLRVSNNVNEFISELKMKLVAVPDLEGFTAKIIFSEVHNLLSSANCVFLLENPSTKELVMYLRVWNDGGIHHEHGLYFFDKITFNNKKISVDGNTKSELRELLGANLVPPNDLTGIILDGSEFTLKRNFKNNFEEYTWKLDSQLNGNTLRLVHVSRTSKWLYHKSRTEFRSLKFQSNPDNYSITRVKRFFPSLMASSTRITQTCLPRTFTFFSKGS